MTIDLNALDQSTRLLFTIELKPLQGDSFQPTGFPSLGAATYTSKYGDKLLVESPQSMANRLETTCWEPVENQPIAALRGVSHVTVTKRAAFLTDSMLEAHRLNSPYLLENKTDTSFVEALRKDLGALDAGPINRKLLAETLLRYDIGSLLHGVFLAKKELAGGRLRVARAISAFIEATGARVAASGGVKNDHVNPAGDTKSGFGNVPFARDEFTADRIDLHVNFDLGQVRGYGLGRDLERLLILLGLHRLRKLLDGDLRLRTACDFEPISRDRVVALRPEGFELPRLKPLEDALVPAIAANASRMKHTTVKYEDELKSAKESRAGASDEDEDGESGEDS
jgi:CRISPR-associated protein Csb1